MENFDPIKKNLDKLNEQPSDAVWNRLEGKLDNLSNKKKISKYKLLSLAASLVALVAVLSIVSQQFSSTNNQMVSLESADYVLEDLSYAEEVDYAPVLVNSYYLENESPIEEGIKKKLLPINRIAKAYPTAKGHFNWIFGTWVFKNAVHKVDEANEQMQRKEINNEAPSLNVGIESGQILLQFLNQDTSLKLNEEKSDSNKVVFEGKQNGEQVIITKVDRNNVILNAGHLFKEDLHLDSNSTLIYQNVITY